MQFARFINVGDDDNPKWKPWLKENELCASLNVEQAKSLCENLEIKHYFDELLLQQDKFNMMSVDPKTGNKIYYKNCVAKYELKLYFKKKGKRYIRKIIKRGIVITGEIE